MVVWGFTPDLLSGADRAVERSALKSSRTLLWLEPWQVLQAQEAAMRRQCIRVRIEGIRNGSSRRSAMQMQMVVQRE